MKWTVYFVKTNAEVVFSRYKGTDQQFWLYKIGTTNKPLKERLGSLDPYLSKTLIASMSKFKTDRMAYAIEQFLLNYFFPFQLLLGDENIGRVSDYIALTDKQADVIKKHLLQFNEKNILNNLENDYEAIISEMSEQRFFINRKTRQYHLEKTYAVEKYIIHE